MNDTEEEDRDVSNRRCVLDQCAASQNPLYLECHSNTWCRLLAYPGVDLGALEEFRRSVPGCLFPWDPEYNTSRLIWNKNVNQFPAIIARCANADEVIASLDWAHAHAVPVTLRAGGHSNEGFCVGIGMVVDVRRMNGLEFVDDETVRLGAGCLIGPTCEALAKHNRMVSAGSCPNVGLTGLALGGGWGYAVRRYGLTCDNILSITVVLPPTSDGGARAVVADARGDHSDLFWACRGAGGGIFGVVADITFRTHDTSAVRFSVVEIVWRFEHCGEVIAAWNGWGTHVDDRLTCSVNILGRRRGVRVYGLWSGDRGALDGVLRTWVKEHRLPPPTKCEIRTGSFLQCAKAMAGNNSSPPRQKTKTLYWKGNLTGEAIRCLTRLGERLEEDPLSYEYISLNPLGGAVSRVPKNDTAFDHRRGTSGWMSFTTTCTDQRDDARKHRRARKMFDAVVGALRVSSPRCYVNFQDADLTDHVRAYWGKTARRLRSIKRKYDPDDFLRPPQGLHEK